MFRSILAIVALAAGAAWAAEAPVSVEVVDATVTLRSPGDIERVQHFALKDPPRLVVDLYGSHVAGQARDMPLSNGFARLRVGAYPDKTRFVFDVAGPGFPAYQVAEGDRRVVVSWQGTSPPAGAPAQRPAPPTGRPPPGAAAPAADARPPAVEAMPPPARSYSEVRTTLVADDAEIRDVLARIAEVSGRRIVVDESVSGRLMVRLVNVPWDQALEMVIGVTGLRIVEEGDALRIVPAAGARARSLPDRELANTAAGDVR